MATMENSEFEKAWKQCKYFHNTGLGSEPCEDTDVDTPRKWVVLGICNHNPSGNQLSPCGIEEKKYVQKLAGIILKHNR